VGVTSIGYFPVRSLPDGQARLAGTFYDIDPFSDVVDVNRLRSRTVAAMPYYSNGFLEAGSAQTGSGLSDVLNRGLNIFETILPRLGSGGHNVPTTQPPPGTATRPPAEHMPGGPMGGPGRTGRRARVLIPAAGAAVAAAGYHIIKKGIHAGQMTKNRHRNVGNIRALRRAISRLHGFERVTRKVIHFVKPHTRGKMVFKRRKKAC
jgi:hypothetical protein